MGLLSLLNTDPLGFFLILILLTVSLTAHEWGHAITALWMGDRTAKDLGRISLNPLKQIDPLGLLMLLIAGFGWAKPVPINPMRFSNYRLGLFIVSIAGIVINLLIATGLAFALKWLSITYPAEVRSVFQSDQHSLPGTLALIALYGASINLTLAVFNFLPIPPLDGSKILMSLLPRSMHRFFWSLEANPYYGIAAMVLFLAFLRQPIGNLISTAQDKFLALFGL